MDSENVLWRGVGVVEKMIEKVEELSWMSGCYSY